MSTLPYVQIPADTWIDLYAESGIDVGIQLIIHNIGGYEARLTESSVEPNKSSGFDPITPREYLTNIPRNDGAWAYSKAGTTLQVRAA